MIVHSTKNTFGHAMAGAWQEFRKFANPPAPAPAWRWRNWRYTVQTLTQPEEKDHGQVPRRQKDSQKGTAEIHEGKKGSEEGKEGREAAQRLAVA
jgi:hypothetical protein